MMPPKREFEQVQVDEWLPGKIIDVQYDEKHEFKSKKGDFIGTATRIIFSLDGYNDKKFSRWMSFSYAENANLYKTFVSQLVLGAHPNMEFDLDGIKEMPIKVMYAQNGEYQNITSVRPLKDKITPSGKKEDSEETPF